LGLSGQLTRLRANVLASCQQKAALPTLPVWTAVSCHEKAGLSMLAISTAVNGQGEGYMLRFYLLLKYSNKPFMYPSTG
jgi:hypothetical protein